jgi:subtilase family serine protease
MRTGPIGRLVAVVVLLLPAVGALAASPPARPKTPPALASQAVDLGITSSARVLTVSAWLRMRQTDELGQAVQAQQDPRSATFQRWADPRAVEAAYAPTADAVAKVSAFLASRGLTVTEVGPQNLFVRARGTAAQVQAAFDVELHDFRLGTSSYVASTSEPSVPSDLQGTVAFIGGLSDRRAKPMNVRPIDPGGRYAPALLTANPNGLFFSASCFRSPQTVDFSSTDVDATYTGNRYGQDITNTAIGTLPPCGYQPSDVQTAYGLDGLYRARLDGRGQTVAIVDAFGSITIEQDVATFSAAMGLPPADLTVIGTPTESDYSGSPNAGWADETTLDVEWVHAIAPRARIVLVVTEDNSFDNLFAGIVTAASVPGVSTISNSWGNVELSTFPQLRQAADDVLKAIAAGGISVHFASGDGGDEAVNLGVADVDWPASSPWVTAIGGVSLSLHQNKRIRFQTAWGNNLTEIADTEALGNPPLDPVLNEGFVFGGGGGISDVYAKPWFQRRLRGDRRQVPDISWLADPYTGVEIIVTGDAAGDQFIEVLGGTSLSCPMFSGLWAIAAQRAGHRLGQAAAQLYDLDGWAITDVRGFTSSANVSGAITDPGGDSPEVPTDLAAPLQNLPDFFSALYNSPFSTRWFVLTFGTDSTLEASDGYDLATGLGTPNGPAFVEAVARRSYRHRK